MASTQSALMVLVNLLSMLHASHFRGGTITWRPLNNTPSGSTVPVQVRERYSWNRNAFFCDATTIASHGVLGGGYGVDYLSGTAGSWTPYMDVAVNCTDFSVNLIVSSGEHYETRILPIGIAFSIGFASGNWFANLVVGSNGLWSVVCRINTAVRPDGYINTSPVAVSLPIIYKQINIQQVHVIQMSDFDGTDILRCRWSIGSTSNINSYDECKGVCNGVPGASLIQNNCTIVFTLTGSGVYAAVALQIEDFYNSAAITPMSSVPLQFLFYGYPAPVGSCTTPPAIIGNRPNRACIGIPIGANVTEYVIVQVYCPANNIVDFVTTSPTGLTKSTILNPSANIYQIILSWVPIADQYGPQSVCAAAVDNIQLQSNQWCITYLVGFNSPDLIRPSMVQGSASPIGTVFQNQTVFSIQTTISVNRPTRNGTYISFYDSTAGNIFVQQYDCGWAPEVTYTGFTIVVRFPVAPWIPGHFYYVTFDSGVASGTEFCGPESAPVTNPTYWVFNIWNPAVSSTTTTTTTFPTTGTVTTRPTSTTTTNPLLTTTGIVITTTYPVTTTATTTTAAPPTTTAASTSTGPTTSGGTTLSTVAVMYPKDLEDACKQPIAIMTAVFMAAMFPIQALTMFAAFTKFSNMFKPSKISAKIRHKQRMRNVLQR